VSVYRERQGRRVKKVAGVVCLLAAFCLVVFGRMQGAADEKDARTYIRQESEARDREPEIASLRNKLSMDALAIGDAIVKHADTTALEAEQAKDKARLGELEQAERIIGTAAMNEDAAIEVGKRRWVVLAEYGGAVVLGLAGIGLMRR
jgi:hypothetical protein